MQLVVTGGAGFIGSNFIRWVLGNTDDVTIVNLDALTYAGTGTGLAEFGNDPRYKFVHGDIRDSDLVREVVSGADALVHFAAESHVDRSITGPSTFLSTNVVGAGIVFEACRHAKVKRVLHISTDEVYGPIETGKFVETDRMAPSSPYAASKAGADLLAQSYATTYGYPIAVTRSTNTFGPWQHPEKLIPNVVTRLIDGRTATLYGDGLQVRDWLAVDDNVRAQWLVLTAGEPGGVYNISADNPRTNLAVIQQVLAQFDRDESLVEYVADRPGHDRRYAVDTSRLRALGWEPTAAFDDALADTVAWYQAQTGWWRPLIT